jgi:hypothetical protein
MGLGVIHALGIGGVVPNVVVEIPTLVFVQRDEDGNELVGDILRAAIGKRHAAAGDDDDAKEAGGDIAKFIGVRVVEPEN